MISLNLCHTPRFIQFEWLVCSVFKLQNNIIIIVVFETNWSTMVFNRMKNDLISQIKLKLIEIIYFQVSKIAKTEK